MSRTQKRGKKRWFVMGMAIAVLTLSTYAFTAGNVVPPTKAGDGSASITGYQVSAVKYNLNVSNPQSIDSLTFTLDSAPAAGSTVKVQLDTPLGSWFTCTMSGTPAVNASCPTAGATVVLADQLTVVAAD